METLSNHRPTPKSRVLGFVLPRHGICPGLLPTVDTDLNAGDTIEGGPNIETEHGAAVGERRGGVVVDDVSDFFACFWTVDDPVVSIEWWLSAISGKFTEVRRELEREGEIGLT